MVDLSIAMLNFQRVPHCSIFHRRHLFPTWNGKCNSCGSGNAKAKIWDATITSLPKTMPGMSCQNDSSLKRNKHQKKHPNIEFISHSLLIRKNRVLLISRVPLLRAAPFSQRSPFFFWIFAFTSFVAKQKHVSLDALQMRCRPEARAGDTPWLIENIPRCEFQLENNGESMIIRCFSWKSY